MLYSTGSRTNERTQIRFCTVTPEAFRTCSTVGDKVVYTTLPFLATRKVDGGLLMIVYVAPASGPVSIVARVVSMFNVYVPAVVAE
jgi:hypothetical protein